MENGWLVVVAAGKQWAMGKMVDDAVGHPSCKHKHIAASSDAQARWTSVQTHCTLWMVSAWGWA